MKTLLIPIDLSDITPLVIDHAMQLARSLKAKAWVIHVAPPDPDFVGMGTGPKYVRDELAHELRAEHRKLQEIASNMMEQGVEASSLLVQGPTTETILDEAVRLKADLIIMGSHGRTGIFKAIVGSTSSDVLEQSPIPVMIVPARRK